MTLKTPLSPDLPISERSRKFYDGTYKWVEEGFWDDTGAYYTFKEDDPEARAPTPLPPSFDEEKADSGTSAISNAPNSPDEPDGFTFPSREGTITVRRDELFCGRSDRDRLLSKLEGIQIGSQHAGTELTLEKCYRLCGLDDAEAGEIMSKRNATQAESSKSKSQTEEKKSESKTAQTPAKTSKDEAAVKSPDSSLSDYPSDVSEAELEKPVKGKKVVRKASASTDTRKKQDDDDRQTEPKAKKGVAQKVVRKPAKGVKTSKSATTAPAPMVTQTNSSADVSASGEDALGRRRSTRLAKHRGK